MTDLIPNYMLMHLPKGKVPVRYIKRDDALLVDLRSLMETMGLAWLRWLDVLVAQVGSDQWPLEAAHDWKGRDTQLLEASHIPNCLGWVAQVAPKMYPLSGHSHRRIDAVRRDWADCWYVTAPPRRITGFVTGRSGPPSASLQPVAVEGSWAGRRGQAITRDTAACVKDMLAAGKGRLEIAADLGISPASVSLLASGKYRFAKAAGLLTKKEMGVQSVYAHGMTCAACVHASSLPGKPYLTVCAKGGFVVAQWAEGCRLHQPAGAQS